jgi:hypothetical protein
VCGASRFYNLFPDDNSLSNLDALRGVFGAYLVVRVRKTSLARHSLSMRKPCLESYILEILQGASDYFVEGGLTDSDNITNIFYSVLTPTKNTTAMFASGVF